VAKVVKNQRLTVEKLGFSLFGEPNGPRHHSVLDQKNFTALYCGLFSQFGMNLCLKSRDSELKVGRPFRVVLECMSCEPVRGGAWVTLKSCLEQHLMKGTPTVFSHIFGRLWLEFGVEQAFPTD
jgi:hypothetical protein